MGFSNAQMRVDSIFKPAEAIARDKSLPWEEIGGSIILITGSTGLICSQLVRAFLAANDLFGANLTLILPVRNVEKAKAMFGIRDDVRITEWSLGEEMPEVGACDYVIHAACSTSGKFFASQPATTINQIVSSGKATLNCALLGEAKKYVFISSMEVYGCLSGEAREDLLGCIDPMQPRSSYPEAKRLIECLCSAYEVEYGLSTVVARLAQTFGEGVNYNDTRVFAEFGREALSGDDVVLFTDGMKRNPYISVDDAVRAIILLMVRGAGGEAYNVANEKTYCSIYEMAEMVVSRFGASSACVRREINHDREASFSKAPNLMLNTNKLCSLGWVAKDDLLDMYNSMFDYWRETAQHS